jgi:branched-chain amino acid transport system ATP-binding protein
MLLKARGVSKRFGGLYAVNQVNLDVPVGSIVAVIGPNGAGKTTFFNIVTGLYTPDAGTIELEHSSLLGLSGDAIARRGVARTFQTIRLFKKMTVLENVLVPQSYPLLNVWNVLWCSERYRQTEAQLIEYAYQALDRVGLLECAEALAGSLSYGQQRRLEVARALALKPKLLLLDEPAAGMNQQEKAHMIHLVHEIRDFLGVTIVLIEHDMEMVSALADQVAVFHHGEVLAEDTPEVIRSHPEVIAAYLGEAL